jgi:hypothetical protein
MKVLSTSTVHQRVSDIYVEAIVRIVVEKRRHLFFKKRHIVYVTSKKFNPEDEDPSRHIREVLYRDFKTEEWQSETLVLDDATRKNIASQVSARFVEESYVAAIGDVT